MRTARVIAMENQVTAKALKDWLGKSRSELEKAIIKLKVDQGAFGYSKPESVIHALPFSVSRPDGLTLPREHVELNGRQCVA